MAGFTNWEDFEEDLRDAVALPEAAWPALRQSACGAGGVSTQTWRSCDSVPVAARTLSGPWSSATPSSARRPPRLPSIPPSLTRSEEQGRVGHSQPLAPGGVDEAALADEQESIVLAHRLQAEAIEAALEADSVARALLVVGLADDEDRAAAQAEAAEQASADLARRLQAETDAALADGLAAAMAATVSSRRPTSRQPHRQAAAHEPPCEPQPRGAQSISGWRPVPLLQLQERPGEAPPEQRGVLRTFPATGSLTPSSSSNASAMHHAASTGSSRSPTPVPTVASIAAGTQARRPRARSVGSVGAAATGAVAAPAAPAAARGRRPAAASQAQRGAPRGRPASTAAHGARGAVGALGVGVEGQTLVSPFRSPTTEAGESAAIVECAICMEAFAEGIPVRTLPCLHRYHVACADLWLAQHPECPICKHRLDGA